MFSSNIIIVIATLISIVLLFVSKLVMLAFILWLFSHSCLDFSFCELVIRQVLDSYHYQEDEIGIPHSALLIKQIEIGYAHLSVILKITFIGNKTAVSTQGRLLKKGSLH